MKINQKKLIDKYYSVLEKCPYETSAKYSLKALDEWVDEYAKICRKFLDNGLKLPDLPNYDHIKPIHVTL